tara:strand:+ start:3983 stop:4825 length:843 start_codon:yes stop_codon:yes gene_type:complete
MEAALEHDTEWLHVVAATLNWGDKSLANNASALKRLFFLGHFERSVLDISERKLLDALKLIPNPNSRAVVFSTLILMRRCAERCVSQLERGRVLLKDVIETHRKVMRAGLELYSKEEMASAIEESAKTDPVRCAILILFEQLGCRVLDLGGWVTTDKTRAEASESNVYVPRAKDVLVIRRCYKTVSTYGVKRDIIRGERGRLLRRCLLVLEGGALIRLKGGSQCPRAQLSARVTEISGVSATKSFKSYVNIMRKAGDIEGIRALAEKRGTDIRTALVHYA